MKAKIITFKPNKSGDVTLYLGQGVDLRELIDLVGQEVDIAPQQTNGCFTVDIILHSLDVKLKSISDYIASLRNAADTPGLPF